MTCDLLHRGIQGEARVLGQTSHAPGRSRLLLPGLKVKGSGRNVRKEKLRGLRLLAQGLLETSALSGVSRSVFGVEAVFVFLRTVGKNASKMVLPKTANVSSETRAILGFVFKSRHDGRHWETSARSADKVRDVGIRCHSKRTLAVIGWRNSKNPYSNLSGELTRSPTVNRLLNYLGRDARVEKPGIGQGDKRRKHRHWSLALWRLLLAFTFNHPGLIRAVCSSRSNFQSRFDWSAPHSEVSFFVKLSNFFRAVCSCFSKLGSFPSTHLLLLLEILLVVKLYSLF